jgi:hypothetical protein
MCGRWLKQCFPSTTTSKSIRTFHSCSECGPCFCDMVVTTFQHLFGIRMHHGAAPDIKKCRHFPGHHAWSGHLAKERPSLGESKEMPHPIIRQVFLHRDKNAQQTIFWWFFTASSWFTSRTVDSTLITAHYGVECKKKLLFFLVVTILRKKT